MEMEYNKVYCGNSDELLIEMIKKGMRFVLILTDPPYNLNKDFGTTKPPPLWVRVVHIIIFNYYFKKVPKIKKK